MPEGIPREILDDISRGILKTIRGGVPVEKVIPGGYLREIRREHSGGNHKRIPGRIPEEDVKGVFERIQREMPVKSLKQFSEESQG